MKKLLKPLFLALCIFVFVSCSEDDVASIENETEITDTTDDSDNTDTTDDSDTTDTNDNSDATDDTTTDVVLHAAFSDFASDIDIVLIDGNIVSIETDGQPDHTSPYWSPTHELYTPATVASEAQMSPGYIDDFEGTYALQVSVNPQKATQTTATSLGAIGIAVSGGVIYNQNEAGNVQITDNVASGLDYSGAHTGPTSYHYHFEPTAFTDDDSNLVGVIADGFFLYGRKCSSTGAYPTDLDASNGHTTATIYSNGKEEYHYHIGNTTIYNKYYVNFTGDYQGTPYAISGEGAGGGPGRR